jgi:RHS repeat-associated protein
VLGSVLATADDGATALSRHYSYDPDGNINLSGSGTDSVLRYVGGYLYHYGARYYDPSTAVWTQQDPLNQIDSLTEANRYTYVGGDPIQQRRPLGLVSCSTFGVGSVCKKARKASEWFAGATCTTVGVVAGGFVGADVGTYAEGRGGFSGEGLYAGLAAGAATEQLVSRSCNSIHN